MTAYSVLHTDCSFDRKSVNTFCWQKVNWQTIHVL